MRRMVFFLAVSLLLPGCDNCEKKDLQGAWLPTHDPSPAFIFFPDSAWVMVRDSVKAFSYAVAEDSIKFYSSAGFTGRSSTAKERYATKLSAPDSMVLYKNYEGIGSLNFTYYRMPLSRERFDKIQYSHSNGWQTDEKVEMNAAGHFQAWRHNLWTKKTYHAEGTISEPDLTKILWGANYLYKASTYAFHRGSCSDCHTYGITLFRANKTVSFFVSERKKPAMANLITATLTGVIAQSVEEVPTIKIPALVSDTYLSRDTMVIESQNRYR